jgi:hypothetical protein
MEAESGKEPSHGPDWYRRWAANVLQYYSRRLEGGKSRDVGKKQPGERKAG